MKPPTLNHMRDSPDKVDPIFTHCASIPLTADISKIKIIIFMQMALVVRGDFRYPSHEKRPLRGYFNGQDFDKNLTGNKLTEKGGSPSSPGRQRSLT